MSSTGELETRSNGLKVRLRAILSSFLPLNLSQRIKESIQDPSLMGEDGAGHRYARIQWCMILWRLLTLVQIPVLLIACPERFLSPGHALTVLGLSFTYTLFFSWLVISMKPSNTRLLHAVDQIICASLLFFAREATLVYIMAFYTYASLLTRPTVRLRDILPAVVGMSLAFLAAASLTPNPFYTPSLMASEFIVYYLWGLGVLGLSKIIARASSLELDGKLEEQRQSYRRRLHDDLGNTLCGLHYKIQSLQHAGGDELNRAFGFLSRGYEQASRVLARLLAGIEEIVDKELHDSLTKIAFKAKEKFSMDVELAWTAGKVNLSPEVRQEVLAIAGEAIANAAKHANVNKARVEVSRSRGRINICITDSGAGYDDARLQKRQEAGSLGVKGMGERAEMIDALLAIDSAPGSGTTVTLTIREQKDSSLLGRIIGNRHMAGTGTYSFLVSLKLLIAVLTVMQVPLMKPELSSDPLVWLIAAAFFIDGLAGFIFRRRLFSILNKLPWLLAGEQIFFCFLIFLSWRQGVSMAFEYSPSAALLVSACFLGILRNVALASVQGLGMIVAYLLTPPAALMRGERLEEMVVSITSNLLIALCGGLAVEFVRSLEEQQRHAITRALSRQRERLSAETHKQLGALVLGLGEEIRILLGNPGRMPAADSLKRLENSSADIKIRLRAILDSLGAASREGAA